MTREQLLVGERRHQKNLYGQVSANISKAHASRRRRCQHLEVQKSGRPNIFQIFIWRKREISRRYGQKNLENGFPLQILSLLFEPGFFPPIRKPQ